MFMEMAWCKPPCFSRSARIHGIRVVFLSGNVSMRYAAKLLRKNGMWRPL